MEDMRERDGSSGNFFTKDRGPVVGIALAVLVVGIVVGVLIALVGVGERTLFPGAGMGFSEREPSACPEWRGPRPSEDWHQTACREDDGFQKVVGTDSGYVAISRDSIWTSPDAIAWSPVPGTNGWELNAIVAATPGVVIVGQTPSGTNARVWFSPDSLTWTFVRIGDETSGSVRMNDVTYANGHYWAVGTTKGPITPVVWFSENGVRWNRVEADGGGFAGAVMSLVTEGGLGLIAVGSRPAETRYDDIVVWTSSDGINWETAVEGQDLFGGRVFDPILGIRQPAAMVAVDDRLVAVGPHGLLGRPGAWLSLDGGRSWKKTSDQPAGNVVRVEGGVVATTPTGLLYSPDGQVWYPLVSFQDLSRRRWSHDNMEPYHVAAAGDRLIVLAQNDAPFFTGPYDRMVAVGPNPLPNRP